LNTDVQSENHVRIQGKIAIYMQERDLRRSNPAWFFDLQLLAPRTVRK
jgi:hypothetical protein